MSELHPDDLKHLRSLVLAAFEDAMRKHVTNDADFLNRVAALTDIRAREAMLVERMVLVHLDLIARAAALKDAYDPEKVRLTVGAALQQMRGPRRK